MLGRALTPASLAGTATFRTVTLASIGLAGALYLSGYQDLIFDAWGYAELARHLSRDGLLAAANENRTYGYPLFIALCTGFQEFAPKTVRLLVFWAS